MRVHPDALLVVHAALDIDRSRAAAAWTAWRDAGGSVDAAPDELVRCLPLVHHNLPAGAIGSEDAGRLAGISRRAWYRHQLRLRAVAPALKELHDRGARVMALKGAAIAARLPHGAALRPMLDIDVLAQPADLNEARSVLAEHGFKGEHPVGPHPIQHAEEYEHPSGAFVDLHWRPMHMPGPHESLWTEATLGKLQGAPILLPRCEDIVLHACVHGMALRLRHVQWIADVVQILRHAGNRFDWDALVGNAYQQRVIAPVADALGVVAAFGVEVPPEIARNVVRSRASRYDRGLYRTLSTLPPGRGVWLAYEWEMYRRSMRLANRRPTPRGFAHALAEISRVRGPRALPAHFARRVVEDSRRRLRARSR
jgi:hypothetical protein